MGEEGLLERIIVVQETVAMMFVSIWAHDPDSEGRIRMLREGLPSSAAAQAGLAGGDRKAAAQIANTFIDDLEKSVSAIRLRRN